MYGSPQPTRPKASKPWLFGCLGCGCLTLLLILLVSCAAVIGSSGSGAPDPQSTESAAEAAASPDDAPAVSDADEEENEPEETSPEPTEEELPEEPEPEAHEGSGDTVLRVDPHEDPRIARITHTGASNFAVWTVDSSGETGDLLVNEIGGYDGTVVYNTLVGEELSAFDITADGSWEITLEPLTSARPWDGGEVSGTGDDVVQVGWDISGLETVEMSHSGSGNFAVWSYGDGRDLLANEIGSYEGEALLSDDTVLFAITADGDWTLSRQ